MRTLPLAVLASTLLVSTPFAPAAFAEVSLPAVFGDHMVVQSGKPVTLWGTTEPGGTVRVFPVTVRRDVTVGMKVPGRPPQPGTVGGTSVLSTADSTGKWTVELPSFEAGTELTLIVADGEAGSMPVSVLSPPDDTADQKVFTDVLVGEVWICSGQSNMEWQVRNSDNPQQEIAAANNPEIRLFTVPKWTRMEPQDDINPGARDEPTDGVWMKVSPESVPLFSAVGYFFGRALHRETGRPVGLINTSWGGTPAEAWTRRPTLESVEELEPILTRWDAIDVRAKTREPVPRMLGPDHPHHPAVLFNGMVAPLVPLPIAGAIWYQGETNASRAVQYRTLMQTMISDWRDAFGQEFPFLITQLANFRERGEPAEDAATSDWAELREAQSMARDELRDVGLAVITDIGEAGDIHPRNKQDVGERLALSALALAYDTEQLGWASPKVDDVSMDGNTAAVTFDTAGGGLGNRGETVEGFVVAGPDRQWHAATAEITGPDTVTVTAPAGVPTITAVRYAWANNPPVTLFNTRGLPAEPFRTDDWAEVTRDNK